MKTFCTGIAFLFFSFPLQAAITYTLSSNTSWNGNFPNNCNNCTFNISAGVTLTLNTNATCHNCTINGGTLTMTQDFTFQGTDFNNTTINLGSNTLNLQNNGTSFTNTIVNATGSSTFNPTKALTITGSTFNFSGTSVFDNNGGKLDINSSMLYFYGDSRFIADAGPVNLNTNSQLIAGDGSVSSKANLIFNGPTLNLVDAGSALYVANVNNYYYNWNSYKSLSNSKTYNTKNNYQNCGGAGQNACQAQYFFGCATFNSFGSLACTTLDVSISNFKASGTGSEVKLSWSLSDGNHTRYLRIEHSSDAIHFNPLTTLEADSQNGDYHYSDFSPVAGENDYRICLINPDGKISYSKIISINNTTSGSQAAVFPNPSSGGQFFIQMPSTETAVLSVYGMDGQLLYLSTLNGQSRYSIHLPQIKNRQFLVIHIVQHDKSSTFNLLNLP
jgi:hypothetical protein